MDFVWDGLLDILFGWIFDLLYLLQSGICSVIDFIVQTFYKLSGLDSVKVDGKETDLLTHFVETPAIRTAFLGVFLVGVILLCVFVLIAIIRSEYADAQHKKTKGQILVKAGQSFLIFLIIPLLLAAGILLTNTVMSAINGSMLAGVSSTGYTSFGGQILVTSGHGAYIGSSGARAEIERKFVSGELDYTNLGVVKQYYDLWNVNYFIGIFSGLVLVILFALAALRFVQRIFDVILLYVISPASIATIPLDDGGRFKLWREMLISKVLSAYGIIFAMNLFFLIVPQINRIQFYSSGFQNALISLLFIIGGAFAVTKAYMVIAQLTGSNAGMQEAQQTMAGIYSGIRMARGTVRFAAGAVGQVIGGSDFRSNQRRGMGIGENLSSSIHGTRNQRVVADNTSRRGSKDDEKEKKNNGAPNGNGGGSNGGGNGGGGSPQGAQTVRQNNNTSSQSGNNSQYRGADNSTQTHTSGGQSATSDSDNRQSHSADSSQYRGADNSTQTHTDGSQSAFMDSDNQQTHSADRESLQTHTDGSQSAFSDSDNRQTHSADRENLQTHTDGGQGSVTDNGNARSNTGNAQQPADMGGGQRGADSRNTQSYADNGHSQPADLNGQRSGADNRSAQDNTGGLLTPFTDIDGNRQPPGAENGNAQSNTDNTQAAITDTNAGQRSGADSNTFANSDSRANPHTNDNTLDDDFGWRRSNRLSEGDARQTDGDGRMTAGQKTAHFIGGIARLSNLPVGFVKDLVQGGVITAGKNLWPRLRNVVKGRGIINHADVRPKAINVPDSATVQTGGAVNPDKKNKKGGKK